MHIACKAFDFSSPAPCVMGILNVTPDSFSDGGRYDNVEAAVNHALSLARDGADIIDIGAESTRPGHTQISVDEECSRLLPVIAALKNATDLPLSVDTYRAPVAEAALAAGADMINDIWGLAYDENMASVVARAACLVCLMHNRRDSDYGDFVNDWLADMKARVAYAKESGIADEQIILDPGIGFAKSFAWDAAALHHLDALCALGYPVLLGVSRKRLIGNLSGLPVDERDEATAAVNLFGYQKGARIFRVHDVKTTRRALDTFARLETMIDG